ncbi:hypothetical protein [Moritella sp.]|uniref:hypothetical protein n=1 Tax=Moritella sp. TaxID=78556 RepID=UPI001D8CF62D|nr:hypothetical protein [Moritella sp.]MCJ8351500.1 hypothetical protein [Moritella sp.]NQZ40262.1 hypothetical protein [Moritella sp.]
MEVRINSKKEILKSFVGWLPLALFCVVFYGMIFVLVIMYLLSNVLSIEEVLARQIGWVIGGALLVFLGYLYINWLTKSLSSYHLSISNSTLRVKGKTGWKSLDIEVPLNTIREINIGQSASMAEKLSGGHGAIQDQVASRLSFIPSSGKPFKLDFAAKAFDNESLFEFLIFAKSKGLQTNVSV